MKKIVMAGIVAVVSILVLTGCTNKDKNLEGKLPEIMDKMYVGIKDLPKLSNTVITNENLNYYTGLDTLDFKEGLASEPFIGSIAHSVVLLRLNDDVDINKVKKDIKEKINPRKWICVAVEEKDVLVANRGNIVALIMVNGDASKIKDNFQKIK